MERRNKRTIALLALAAAVLILAGVWFALKQQDEGGVAADYRGHGGTFKNPLAEIDAPDPSVVFHDGYYYMTFTHNGTDVMVMKSRTLDFRLAERKVVWYPPIGTMYSANLWAPEIQRVRDKWYIYFAADDGKNENHRMYALEAATDDPMGEWTFRGQVTDETNKWAIDGLTLEHEGKLYFVWSGWEGDVNVAQNTYIAPMSDPVTISGPRVLLSEPEFDWERLGGPPYINEGQAILKKNGRVFLFYSASGSWTPFYQLGMLTLEPGGDPLDPEAWTKSTEPLFVANEEGGVFGPGHNSFTTSPDGTEDWIVYHATSGRYDGWANRKARAQKVEWTEDGFPSLGVPQPLEAALAVPSGAGVFRAEHARAEAGRLAFDGIPSTVETDAPLLLHYRLTGDAAATVELQANGEPAGAIELAPTPEGAVGYAYATVPLRAEKNEIAIVADGGAESGKAGAPEVLAIELPRFEAEFARAEGGAAAEDNPFASGAGVAELAGEGASLVFERVNVPAGGAYTLRFAAANASGSDATITVRANGGKRVEIVVPAGERNRFDPVDATLTLRAGANEITLEAKNGSVVVDYLDVRK